MLLKANPMVEIFLASESGEMPLGYAKVDPTGVLYMLPDLGLPTNERGGLWTLIRQDIQVGWTTGRTETSMGGIVWRMTLARDEAPPRATDASKAARVKVTPGQ